jgi:nucleotide-binding universal stress UspA family protein
MLSEDCSQTGQATAAAKCPDTEGVSRASVARVILIAEEPKDLSPAVLAMAEELRDTLGLGLRILPSIPRDIHGGRLEILLRQASLPDVALVVLGSPQRRQAGSHDPLWHALLRRCPRPLLFVGPGGRRPCMVAATDCSDPSLPVVREASIVGRALGLRLTLVHNIDQRASQFAERIRFPMSTSLADLLAARHLEHLEQRAADSEVVITRDDASAHAVLEVAEARQAALLVVGVKPPEVASHRTANDIFDGASQSVLFIPLPAQGKSLLD